MELYLIVTGTLVYALVAFAFSMMCTQPITYQLWLFGGAAFFSFPFFWLGLFRSQFLVRKLGGRTQLLVVLLVVLAIVSITLAYVTSGSDADCRAVKDRLEALEKLKGGEQ